jgi:cytoskeletal protein RodZ
MSFGEEIRRERELRQISLREVAQATKINLRYLEAMERNEFGYLPGGLFNRAFVRAYCEHIGVDSESMVNAYLLEEQTQDTHGTARHRSVMRRRPGADGDTAPADEPRRRLGSLVKWGLFAILAAVVIAGLIFATLQFSGAAETPAAPRAHDGDRPEASDG